MILYTDHEAIIEYKQLSCVVGLYSVSSRRENCVNFIEEKGKGKQSQNSVDGLIFIGTNFRGLNKNGTFVGFKIRVHSIVLHIYSENCHFVGTGIHG